MKAHLAVIVGLFALSACSTVFACCDSQANTACESCQSDAYDAVQSPCQCTDPRAGENPCLSRHEFCEAFGNVGAR